MKRSGSRRAASLRARTGALAVAGVLALVVASCTPPPTTFDLGPLTVPLPPISASIADPVEYEVQVPGIPSVQLTPYIPPIQLTPYIPPVELTPYIPPVELTPYIPPVCIPFVGCSPAVPATYSPAVPATYSPEVPATYSPEVPATYSPEVPGGTCSAMYAPPSFSITDMTATLPEVTVDAAASTVVIPNVTIDVPAADVIIGSGSVGCSVLGLPAVNLSTGDVKLTFPAQSVVQQATLNLATGVLTLSNPSFTVTGVGLSFLGLNADFDLPNITIPLPTITVPLT